MATRGNAGAGKAAATPQKRAEEGARGGGGGAAAADTPSPSPRGGGGDGGEEGKERRKRAALKQFYQNAPSAASSDPLDIDGASFNVDGYLQKLYRQYDLSTLMKKEDEFSQQMRVSGRVRGWRVEGVRADCPRWNRYEKEGEGGKTRGERKE